MKFRIAFLAGTVALSTVVGLVDPATAAERAVAVLKPDKCALHVNIPHPHARQTETLTVTTTAAGTTVQVKIKYKTVTHTWNLKTGSNKQAIHKFGVGNPTKNYRVTLNGKVTIAPKGYKTGATCGTSFVPS